VADVIRQKEIIVFTDEYDNEPYTEWIDGLRDKKGANRIRSRIRRLGSGHYGDCSTVGEGVLELRLFFGPGYRVYFGEDGENIVVLLCGGDKDTQDRDIKVAKQYWKEYKTHG
jgi:putative addiction module killer protein